MPRADRGIESLPVVVLLSAVLGASALAVGVACLDQARRASERQRATDSFNSLVERLRILSAGGVGSAQLLELDLGSYSIRVDDRRVQLMRGGALSQSDVLPIPLSTAEGEIRSGTYLITLEREGDGELVFIARRS